MMLSNWSKLNSEVSSERFSPDLSSDEETIVRVLTKNNDLQINLLSIQSNIPISRLTGLLFTLEMKGVIRAMAGGCYHLLA